MLDQLTHKDFSPHLNSIFTIHHSETESIQAELVGVETLGHEPGEGGASRWPFALVFLALDQEEFLTQQIYRITHPEIGELEIFLVPLGPGELGFRYEAVFT